MAAPLHRALRGLVLVAAGAALLLCASPALAEAPSVWWGLGSGSVPTYLPSAGTGQIIATANNLGDTAISGATNEVRLTDTLPAGLKATAVRGIAGSNKGRPGVMTCPTQNEIEATEATREITCRFKGSVLSSYERLEMQIVVRIEEPKAAAGSPNQVSVSGGQVVQCNEVAAHTGAFTDSFCKVMGEEKGSFERQPGAAVLPSQLQRTLKIAESTPFGVEQFELKPENVGGSPDVQAGSHPFQMTTTLDLNQLEPKEEGGKLFAPVPALLKDLAIKLPPGLVGDPNAIPDCPDPQFTFVATSGVNRCAPNTAVGVAVVTLDEPQTLGIDTLTVPVFKLVPAAGEPARFGFEANAVPVVLDTSVRTGSDYSVVVSVNNSTQVAAILGSEVTLWGVPGDSRHDPARGWECLVGGEEEEPCRPPAERSSTAFLSLPTTCGSLLQSTVAARSWEKGAEFLAGPPSSPQKLECPEPLPFEPSIAVNPDAHSASTPSGIEVKVRVPQETTLQPNGLAESDVRRTTLALPEGVQTSPGAASGLLACSAMGVGFPGSDENSQSQLEGQLENNQFSPDAVSCPNESKIGTVHIKTPLLAHELTGGVYLAAQDTNPFRSPLVLYLIAEDKVSGVRVKLAGEVAINPGTGQLVSTFNNTPPLPFEELTLNLFNGGRATQSTPSLCGEHTTTSTFTPWSAGPVATPSATFAITSGPNGSACANPLPFAPSFQAGTTNKAADAFTPFTLAIGRPDGNQALKSLSMRLPPGLAAMISAVTPCGEPQAAQGTCGSESLIGHASTSSGLGPEPFTLPGQVFLTGPYKGAPFGLSVVTPALAGPFNLGNVVVRSTINVDRNTAAAIIDTEGIPDRLKGVPSQIKALNVTIERPGGAPFQFNPTNCNPMAITGTLVGYGGASEAVSYPFQVANCAQLPFHPVLTAQTSAKTSKTNGASLTVTVTSTPGQANIAKTKVVFPVILPSRLTTIQKACLAAVFEVNPAGCPEGSVIGEAIAHTPVFKNPLRGPAYLVSHGAEAFPDAEFVLQGEGVTLVLDGKTNIHKGVTSSSFETVPDAPVSRFEVILPEGPHSAFAANGNLCANTATRTVRRRVAIRRHGHTVHVLRKVTQTVRAPLVLPTTIVGQNGATIVQNTNLAVIGCPTVKGFKAKKAKPKHHKPAKKKH